MSEAMQLSRGRNNAKETEEWEKRYYVRENNAREKKHGDALKRLSVSPLDVHAMYCEESKPYPA